MSIQIENLTQEQCKMLDVMWSFDSSEEYLNWYEGLTAKEKHQADILQRLVILETMEEMLSDVSSQYADVRAYLKKFML